MTSIAGDIWKWLDMAGSLKKLLEMAGHGWKRLKMSEMADIARMNKYG